MMLPCGLKAALARLAQSGPPLDVYNRPVTLFVTGLIGSPPMNLIEMTREGLAFRQGAQVFLVCLTRPWAQIHLFSG
jgi:ABC-type sugar transport system ATPase subunit